MEKVSRRPHCCGRCSCEVGLGYAITDRINCVVVATADDGAALAVYELVRWRFSVGSLADPGIFVSAIDDALVFGGATFIRRTLGFDPDRGAGSGVAHRHFAHALSATSYCGR